MALPDVCQSNAIGQHGGGLEGKRQGKEKPVFNVLICFKKSIQLYEIRIGNPARWAVSSFGKTESKGGFSKNRICQLNCNFSTTGSKSNRYFDKTGSKIIN